MKTVPRSPKPQIVAVATDEAIKQDLCTFSVIGGKQTCATTHRYLYSQCQISQQRLRVAFCRHHYLRPYLSHHRSLKYRNRHVQRLIESSVVKVLTSPMK